MPSPFPGMDPYLEAHWGDVHARLVIYISEQLQMLLPGDLEKNGIDCLLAQPPCDCDVLLVPHHGSAQSNPSGFAGWSTPEWVVISGGHDINPAVQAAYEGRGAQVLHTARDGAVRVTLRSDSVEVFHWGNGAFQPAGER